MRSSRRQTCGSRRNCPEPGATRERVSHHAARPGACLARCSWFRPVRSPASRSRRTSAASACPIAWRGMSPGACIGLSSRPVRRAAASSCALHRPADLRAPASGRRLSFRQEMHRDSVGILAGAVPRCQERPVLNFCSLARGIFVHGTGQTLAPEISAPIARRRHRGDIGKAKPSRHWRLARKSHSDHHWRKLTDSRPAPCQALRPVTLCTAAVGDVALYVGNRSAA